MTLKRILPRSMKVSTPKSLKLSTSSNNSSRRNRIHSMNLKRNLHLLVRMEELEWLFNPIKMILRLIVRLLPKYYNNHPLKNRWMMVWISLEWSVNRSSQLVRLLNSNRLVIRRNLLLIHLVRIHLVMISSVKPLRIHLCLRQLLQKSLHLPLIPIRRMISTRCLQLIIWQITRFSLLVEQRLSQALLQSRIQLIRWVMSYLPKVNLLQRSLPTLHSLMLWLMMKVVIVMQVIKL